MTLNSSSSIHKLGSLLRGSTSALVSLAFSRTPASALCPRCAIRKFAGCSLAARFCPGCGHGAEGGRRLIAMESAAVDDRRRWNIGRTLGAWTLIASVAAGAFALLAGVALIPPSRDELRQAARALVPPSATTTDLGENTGSELVSGQYFASADFAANAPTSEELNSSAIEHAVQMGWEIIRVDEGPYARETWLRRGMLIAELFVPDERVEGEWHVREDRGATRGAVLAVVIAAPVVVVAGSVLVSVALHRPTGI
jgi:hypothetical protein